MPDLAPFPDIAATLLASLAEFGTTGMVTRTDALPFHRIRRVGGSGNLITDHQRVEILTFSATYAQGMLLARQIQQRMISNFRAAPKVDRVTSDGPSEVPYDDPAIRCIRHVYDVAVRR